MKNRQTPFKKIEDKLNEAVLNALKRVLETLSRDHDLGTVVSVPSRTWAHREEVTRILAEQIDATPLIDFLEWNEVPEHRQGELLNNDQRRANVEGKMTFRSYVASNINGDVLLLDDYVGSRATLQEAARVFQKEYEHPDALVPLTIARVQWKLGAPGIV